MQYGRSATNETNLAVKVAVGLEAFAVLAGLSNYSGMTASKN